MNGFTILFSPRATRRTTLVAIVMLLPALQQPQAQPAGLADIKASNAFIDCLLRAARRLDDGRSAPASVGKSAQAACPDEQRRWEDAQTAKYSGSKKRAFLEGIQDNISVIATQIVLEKRRLKM